jgi:hypothetical protein
MIYVTLIVSSIGPSDVSSRPLLPGLFWCHFLLPNFLAGHHTKVAIHSISLSLPLSPLRQQPCLKAQRTEQWLFHGQGGCIARIVMSSPTGTKKTTQENLHCVFYKCPYFSVSVPCFSFASRLSVRLCVVNLVF